MKHKTKIAAILISISLVLFGCGSKNDYTVEETTEEVNEVIEVGENETPLEALLAQGEDIYQAKCEMCHKNDGSGIGGKVPPLANSKFLNDNIENGIHIVLNGLEGEIEVNGKIYDSKMPKLDLTESEVAKVLSYVLNKWGNVGDIITKYEVREVANRINPAVSNETLNEMTEAGKAIYTEKCRLCHLADGSGQDGITPPLNNSNFLLKHIDKGIEFVTRGYSGEITVNGKNYNGTMPPQNLTTEQTAEVLTYILNSWDNPGIVVTQEDVDKVLESLPSETEETL